MFQRGRVKNHQPVMVIVKEIVSASWIRCGFFKVPAGLRYGSHSHRWYESFPVMGPKGGWDGMDNANSIYV